MPTADAALPIACPLCETTGGPAVWRDADWHVLRVPDADFPGFFRVISNAHVGEFSDLTALQRRRCMDLVVAVEQVLRKQLAPTKINLAALGNMVPHLHWHVVARFDWDSHFPNPIWGARLRDVSPPAAERLGVSLASLDAEMTLALNAV